MLAQREKSIRIVLIDDHAMLRSGLRMALESHPGLVVVGEAANRAQALDMVSATKPDIILLDLDLGEESGVDLLPELLDIHPGGRVILLTGLRDPQIHRQAISLGALGLVLKEKGIETMIKAIEKVHAGEVWLDRVMIANILNAKVQSRDSKDHSAASAKIATLTKREREVIGLIGRGMKNKQIAEQLVISEATVRHHLSSIFAKLGVEDRLELVVYAYQHGIAGLDQ